MSIRISSKRLAQSAAALNGLTKSSSTTTTPLSPYLCQRTVLGLSKSKQPSQAPAEDTSNPVLEEFLKKKAQRSGPVPRPTIAQGTLPPSSIFNELPVEKPRGRREQLELEATAEKKPSAADRKVSLDKELMASKLDPDPRGRRRWERKMVIRSIQRRGRLTKPQLLKRTERESSWKSPFLPTSVKKLTKLANQIAGKPIDEAIVQMRFSKKKVAQDVLKTLNVARDKAIVERGMGLGKAEGRTGASVEIELKDGKKKIVTDRTSIYVDQAWVGRGSYTGELEYRAMGRTYVLKHPTTSISVLLKEEATRVRESEERKKKRNNRKLWVQLPDRPVTAQRQYCLW